MRLLVTGSRMWDDRFFLYRTLYVEVVRPHWLQARNPDDTLIDYYPPPDFTLVHGHCPRGADKMADDWGQSHTVNIERHPAEWIDEHGRYDKSAGFRRNAEMVRLGADLCLAFIKGNSRGATHTARLAENAGIKTLRFYA